MMSSMFSESNFYSSCHQKACSCGNTLIRKKTAQQTMQAGLTKEHLATVYYQCT